MPLITVILRDGETRQISVPIGLSLMEGLRDGGIDEVLALCGGCCSCATCHVHIQSDFLSGLPEMGADEDDLLESSSYRNVSSRLSCQIPVTEMLDGLVIHIAPEE